VAAVADLAAVEDNCLARRNHSLHTVVAAVADLAAVEDNLAVGAFQEVEETALERSALSQRGYLG